MPYSHHSVPTSAAFLKTNSLTTMVLVKTNSLEATRGEKQFEDSAKAPSLENLYSFTYPVAPYKCLIF